MPRFALVAVLGMAVSTFAAASSPPPKTTGADASFQGSCMESNKTMCSEYAGQSPQVLKDTEAMCVKPPPAGTSGSWSATTRCPAAGRFGRCVKTLAGMTTTQHFYGPPAKVTQDFCKNMQGAWKDG